jgi:hypothetical protein
MSGHRLLAVLTAGALLALPSLTTARQNILLNGSMELGPGAGGIDPQVPAEWVEFGENVERSATVNFEPPDGGWALKAFGDPGGTSAGASQIVDNVTPGQSVSASVWLYTPSFDKLGGTGEAGLVVEFLDFFGGTINLQTDYVLTAQSPADTWIEAFVGPLTAPAGTEKVRISCRLGWNPPDISGAAYWDFAELTVDGNNVLLNGDFEEAGNSPGQSSVGIDDWLGFNDQEKSDDYALDGDHSLRLGVRETYNGLYQNMRTLEPNDQIRLKAWVLNPSIDPLQDPSRAGIKLEFDAASDVPAPEEFLGFTGAEPTDTWTLVEYQTTVPADVTVARVVAIYVPDPNETGVVYFDDMHAGATANPGDNLLANESFETGTGVPTGWTDFGTASKDCFSVFRTGVCSVVASDVAVAGVWQEVTVTPGQDLYVSTWVQTPGFNPITGPLTAAGIKVEWFAGGVPDDIDIGAQNNEIDFTAPLDTWIPMTIDYTMGPDESALARFTTLTIKGVAQTGAAYFDACEAVLLNRFDGSDVDGDDDQDLVDAAWLQRTFTGAGAGLLPFNGLTFDHDDDVDVDNADFDYFDPRMTGPA